MKKTLLVILCLVLLGTMLTACGGKYTIVGKWESETDVDNLGLHLTDDFITTVTRVIFTEEGTGAWEIELVQTREILRREFTYVLEGDTLKISYPDNTRQEFQIDFEKGILLLTGRENFSLKRMQE